ncbi:hypothetical protein O0I10_010722 [Lichtheimia ornata]|uniref:SWIRM domain-containing protein n=1 Tax=Lichtheimia ornata TaxID=688661 RepID=A0AAD7UUN6_9FUNG|nr:uncharacterized protein O0I10_010722 [Lichtheimia ornata]KAJ8653575.1 hypothetical protein O0I10_010722 [Lichtheimia ornata]
MGSSSNTSSPTDSVFHVCVSESTCHRHPPSVLPKKQQPILDERVPVPPLHAMPIKKRPLQHPDNNDNNKGIKRRKRGLDDPVSLVSLSIHKPRRRTNKRHPTTKKAETNAALAYDTIDPEAPESKVFDASCWIPDIHVFDAKPTVSVRWKGTPLDIRSCKYYERLHPGEVAIASTLRLFPEQYIRCKRALILAAQDAYKNNTPFRKSEAQKLCRIDVNKISHLWSAFGRLGWLGPKWPGSNMINNNNNGSATL